jgi:hypothetical protein
MQSSGNRHIKRSFHSPAYVCRKLARHTTLILFFNLFFIKAYPQLNDIGFGLGGFNMTSDLSRSYDLKNERPAATVFLRTNISNAIGLRYGITGGWLAGKSKIAGDTSLPVSFNLTLVEASVMMECHFLDYKSKHAKIHWSPVLFIGAGCFVPIGDITKNSNSSPVQPVIPLGFGFKYNINPKFDLGVEASARVTFYDYLDNISGYTKDYRYGNKYDFDVYYFFGFTLYYTFYIIPCPYGYD